MMKLIYAVPLAVTLLLTGCGSTPTVAAYKAEGFVITGVDATMNGWRDYVVAGGATQTQVNSVKKAYGQYVDAQKVAKAALETAIADPTKEDELLVANTAVSIAKNALIDLVHSFIVK